VGILLGPEETPCGICTSSGRVGHSISFGKADAVTIVAADAALADAVATQTCNMVQTEDDLNDASISRYLLKASRARSSLQG
jgi:ApbE superfamily uncharacterized protein (UPF0280 family)